MVSVQLARDEVDGEELQHIADLDVVEVRDRQSALVAFLDLADIVVDTTSVAAVVNQVGDLLKMEGQFILQGYYPGETPVCFDGLHGKRALIRIPCAQSKEAHEYCHRLMEGGMLKLDGFVTHTFAPQEASGSLCHGGGKAAGFYGDRV